MKIPCAYHWHFTCKWTLEIWEIQNFSLELCSNVNWKCEKSWILSCVQMWIGNLELCTNVNWKCDKSLFAEFSMLSWEGCCKMVPFQNGYEVKVLDHAASSFLCLSFVLSQREIKLAFTDGFVKMSNLNKVTRCPWPQLFSSSWICSFQEERDKSVHTPHK